jgi:hypothetical protein
VKSVSLSPRQVIVPFEFLLHSESMLKLYFRIIQRGSGDVLPPVLVARPGHSDREFIRTRSVNHTETEELFNEIDDHVARRGALYLIDGNHRAVAATLCRRPLAALEIESDDDLEELEKMAARGDYLNVPAFPLEAYEHGWLPTKLAALVTSLEERHQGREVLTLEDRTKRLAKERQIPDYMIRWFRSRRAAASR